MLRCRLTVSPLIPGQSLAITSSRSGVILIIVILIIVILIIVILIFTIVIIVIAIAVIANHHQISIFQATMFST